MARAVIWLTWTCLSRHCAGSGRDLIRPPFLFFFNDTATTEIYTLSLHDALPIFATGRSGPTRCRGRRRSRSRRRWRRSEEHTSELQSHHDLVCRLLLEKKKEARIMHKRYENMTAYSNGPIPTPPAAWCETIDSRP